MKYLICVDNTNREESLTIGKKYLCVDTDLIRICGYDIITIINNQGVKYSCTSDRFKIIDCKLPINTKTI
jgi:hypothetical protein